MVPVFQFYDSNLNGNDENKNDDIKSLLLDYFTGAKEDKLQSMLEKYDPIQATTSKKDD